MIQITYRTLTPLTFLLILACGQDPVATAPDPAPPQTDQAPEITPPPQDDGAPPSEPESGSCAQTIANSFAPYSELVTAECGETYLHLHSPTGLPDPNPADPDERMMVGITRWILRVPAPYDYQWRIPLTPEWQYSITEASPKGPIAVAANGVPIFHYEARPDVATHIEHYDPGSDTVVQGELDHCGGHAGQGDDYHYHYAPICLLDRHDLTTPIAFGLDGAPVYFGTGGTNYYGNGKYNDVNHSPATPLDDCNSISDGNGGHKHYTTKEPPYLIGCHHGKVDPSLRIEPRPMREQGATGPYGGRVGEASNTEVTNLILDSDGWYQLEHRAFTGSGTSGVRFRRTTEDCYDFDFREDISQPGVTESHCRSH